MKLGFLCFPPPCTVDSYCKPIDMLCWSTLELFTTSRKRCGDYLLLLLLEIVLPLDMQGDDLCMCHVYLCLWSHRVSFFLQERLTQVQAAPVESSAALSQLKIISTYQTTKLLFSYFRTKTLTPMILLTAAATTKHFYFFK